MFRVVSSLFHVICFPHEGKIVTINQLAFFSSNSSNGNVPYVGNTNIPYESVWVGIFKDSSLMGKFSLPPPHVTSINMISTSSDPWIILTPDQVDSFSDAMLLSPLEQAYQQVVLASTIVSKSHTTLSMHLDMYSQSPWLGSWDSLDPLNKIFPTNESIFEVMYIDETPWNDAHHLSSFLPSPSEISLCLETFVSHNPMHPLQIPFLVRKVLSKGNMGNITATMPINISIKPWIVENIHIRVSYSLEEIRVYTDLFKEFHDVFTWSY